MITGIAGVLAICGGLSSTAAQKFSNSRSSSEIKNLLKKDFDLDVNISGGTGQSLEDPIIVLSSSESEASQTELLVLRGLGKGRSILWRSLGADIVHSSTGKILRRKIETKYVRRERTISQVENYYFLRSNTDASLAPSVHFIVHTDPRAALEFPYELSWLHYDKRTDFEMPGLGYSLAYNAPGVKATVYVYPIAGHPPNYMSELTRARGEVELVHGKNAIHRDWEIQDRGDHAFYYFSPSYKPSHLSFILVSTRRDHFVKVRGTFVDHPLLREVSKDFLASLTNLIRLRRNLNDD
jgi:hypothetical protein